MGYYENIGESCREYERRRVAMSPLRRKLTDALWNTVIYGTSALILIIQFSPFWLPFVR
jgi:hypothetical protein